MNIGEALFKQIGNPLEWSSAKKANLLLWIYLGQQCIYLIWLDAVLRFDPFDEMANQAYAQSIRGGFELLLAFSLLLIAATRAAQSRYQTSVVYEYIATFYFGVSHLFYGYCIGMMSMPVGVVLAGAPVVGFIFFDRTAVAVAFVSSVVLLVGVTLLTTAEVMPYAPLAQGLYRPDGQLSSDWTMAYVLFSLPHLLVLFGMAYYVLQRWRLREEEVIRLSRIDSLTGLMNRRHVMQVLESEQQRCERNHEPLAVVMVDLDHFKRINDGWGHDAGDRALVMASEALRSTVRQHDHVGRYGGEEFLVVLPGMAADQARQLAERIRASIASVVLELSDGESLSLSASLGMSCSALTSVVSADDLIKRADIALYQAKDAGRDRLVVAT